MGEWPTGEAGAGALVHDLPEQGEQWSGTGWPKLARAAGIGVVLGGILLRVLRYRGNRSLWNDEAMLALNILHRSFAELMGKLDNNQGAPLAFLWAEKLAVKVFGPSEYALRLFPLIAGILSLVLFYFLARRVLRWEAGLAAVILYAVAESGLYYSSEVKQYSVDALMATLILLVGVTALQRGLDRRGKVYLLLVGLVAPWFSHSSVFMLTGLGAALAIHELMRRRRKHVGSLVMIGLAWLAGFGVLYWISLRIILSNPFYEQFWAQHFLPFPPRGLGDLRVYAFAYFKAFPDALGVTFYPEHELIEISSLAGALFLVGLMHLNQTRSTLAAMLAIPLVVTAIASMLHYYPFSNRLLVFLSPVFVLGISAAFEWLMNLAKTRRERLDAGLFVTMCLAVPVLYAAIHLSPTPLRQEIKAPLSIVEKESRPGDWLFVNYQATPQFEYYRGRYNLKKLNVVTNIVVDQTAQTIVPVVKEMSSHRRVWVLFTAVHPNLREEKYLESPLQRRGAVKKDLTGPGYRLVLYEPRALPATVPPSAAGEN